MATDLHGHELAEIRGRDYHNRTLMKRPLGVALIGCWCLAAGIYLCSIAVLLILAPKAVSTVRHLPFVYTLKTVSPYPTLITGIVWSALAWGILRMRDWARLVGAIFLSMGAALALFLLISGRHSSWRIAGALFEMALRVVAVCYLMLPATAEAFGSKGFNASSPGANP
jgi:hypothetical protein